MAGTSDNFADGGVHELTQGSSEFSAILASAAGRNQVVLLDFSATWCGPCRMLAPHLATLAREHVGRLVVVKMDCEKTAANQQLTAQSGITAFPTLHLYRNYQRVQSLQGANPNALRTAVQQQIALLGPAPSSSTASMAHTLAAELAKIKSSCSPEEFVGAAKTLVTFISNIINHPNDAKYRRVKLSNAAFQAKLGSKAGGKGCMVALGFKEFMEAGESVLVLDSVSPELAKVKTLLEDAINRSEAASTTGGGSNPTPQPQPTTSLANTSTNATSRGDIDAAALAQSLARVMGTTTTTTATATTPPQQRQPGIRQVLVTPAKLAKVLERILLAGGLGGPQSQQ